MLPHFPWEFLPSGRKYIPMRQSGLDFPRWAESEWWALQGQQRHLLQVGFVDRLLGELLERLKALGLYEKSLIVVTSDHGAAFWPGGDYRAPSSESPEDVMRVPLFVKLPGQRVGQVSDRNVETIDVLPTVLDVIGAAQLPPFDGCSAVDPSCSVRGTKVFFAAGVESHSPDLSDRTRGLARKHERFRRGPSALFALGPHRDLVGRRVRDLPDSGVAALAFRREREEPRDWRRHADVRIRGWLTKAGRPRRRYVAVAVGGQIQTVAPILFSPGARARLDPSEELVVRCRGESSRRGLLSNG